jgi:hypothetical protein
MMGVHTPTDADTLGALTHILVDMSGWLAAGDGGLGNAGAAVWLADAAAEH